MTALRGGNGGTICLCPCSLTGEMYARREVWYLLEAYLDVGTRQPEDAEDQRGLLSPIMPHGCHDSRHRGREIQATKESVGGYMKLIPLRLVCPKCQAHCLTTEAMITEDNQHIVIEAVCPKGHGETRGRCQLNELAGIPTRKVEVPGLDLENWTPTGRTH